MTVINHALARAVALVLVLCGARLTHAAAFEVVDGDTIKSGETTYRLYGIDAAEAGQRCNAARGGTWACGKAATQRMGELVIGRSIVCDNRGLDDHGRVLAVCTYNGRAINETMVRESLAWSFRRYAHLYDAVEDSVRPQRRGIWQADTEAPWDFRARRWKVEAQRAPAGCPIKGNISKKTGERIYHAPWSRDYDKAHIDTSRGERWFCSEDEAIKAGWRAPLWGRRSK